MSNIRTMHRSRRSLFLGFVLLVASAACGIHEFNKPKVENAGDLAAVSGHLSSYAFRDLPRGWHHYVIRLSEYQATFQIPADFIGFFSKAAFESESKIGDSFWVSIPKTEEQSLNSNRKLIIFSARTTTGKYLDENNALIAYNSESATVIFALFFVAGVALIIFNYKPHGQFREARGR